MKRVGLTVTFLMLATLLFVSNMAPVSAGVYSGTARDDRNYVSCIGSGDQPSQKKEEE